jgi:hypothetical protein
VVKGETRCGKGTMPQAGMSRVRDPLRLMNFFSVGVIHPVAVGPGVTYPLTEMKSRKIMFLGSRARPMRKTHKLSDICEPTVETMRDP